MLIAQSKVCKTAITECASNLRFAANDSVLMSCSTFDTVVKARPTVKFDIVPLHS